MEIVNIEKNALERLRSRFLDFKEQVLKLCNQHRMRKMGDWLDNQDVCLLLNISSRTLQTYRDTGKIGFSRINHKMYYKASDVEELLTKNRVL